MSEIRDDLVEVNLEDVKFRRLFVGNIDHSWEESVISDYFSNIGVVEVNSILFQYLIKRKEN